MILAAGFLLPAALWILGAVTVKLWRRRTARRAMRFLNERKAT